MQKLAIGFHLYLYLYLTFLITSSAEILTPSNFQILQIPFYTGDLAHMYSGFLPVTLPANQTDPNKALFFWLFMNESKPIEDSPLVLWLNGGPGASSQLGLFTENGPFQIHYNETTKEPYFVQNKYSWSTISHFLVVDQPAGTGYSYAKDQQYLVTTDQQVAIDFRYFMLNFFQVFTDLKSNPFYITGESYCGKYLPYIADEILNHPEDEINLTAMILGNGYIDPVYQRISMRYVAESIGLVSGNQKAQLGHLQKQCLYAFQHEKDQSLQQCNKIPDYIELVSGGIDIYNVQQFADNSTLPFQLYLNGNYTLDVLNALHVQNSPKTPIYQVSSSAVDKAMSKVNTNSSIPIVNSLLQRGFPMFWYIGQFDGQDGVMGHEYVLSQLDWDLKSEFDNSPRWFYIPSSDKSKKAGYFKQVQNFTWMIFSGAGHLVPSNQPKNALHMISDYIDNNYALPKNDGYNAAQSAMCQFMNFCSNHGQCDKTRGICQCDDGFSGQDCSESLDQKFYTDIGDYQDNPLKISLEPQSWYYFKTTSNPLKSQHLSFQTTNQQKFSVYGLRKGFDKDHTLPDQNTFDYKVEEVFNYVHYVEQQYRQFQNNQELVAVYNPCFKRTSNISIYGMTIYSSTKYQQQKSFWSAPNFGFWMFIVVVVGTLVSLAFNLKHYCLLKKLSKHSYSSRNLLGTNYGTNIESKVDQISEDDGKFKNEECMKQQLLSRYE